MQDPVTITASFEAPTSGYSIKIHNVYEVGTGASAHLVALAFVSSPDQIFSGLPDLPHVPVLPHFVHLEDSIDIPVDAPMTYDVMYCYDKEALKGYREFYKNEKERYNSGWQPYQANDFFATKTPQISPEVASPKYR